MLFKTRKKITIISILLFLIFFPTIFLIFYFPDHKIIFQNTINLNKDVKYPEHYKFRPLSKNLQLTLNLSSEYYTNFTLVNDSEYSKLIQDEPYNPIFHRSIQGSFYNHFSPQIDIKLQENREIILVLIAVENITVVEYQIDAFFLYKIYDISIGSFLIGIVFLIFFIKQKKNVLS